jgi:tetratricopeptide (TPR) repeat protein
VRRAAQPALDPETRAALEEERDFLLRSLDDLEREHDAGDVDDPDYLALRDDYTARAAAVIRTLEQERVAPSASAASATPGRRWPRRLAWVALIAAFAVVAGVLMARASGSRRDGDTATGDIPLSTRQLLIDAQTKASQGDLPGAIKIYDKALSEQPSNVEALTYRGWAKFRNGDTAGAQHDFDDAVGFDAKYPDVRVFRAVADLRAKNYSGAAGELAVFDTLNPPQLMIDLVNQQRLRERIRSGGVADKLLVDPPTTLGAAGVSVADALQAADDTTESGDLQNGLKLYDMVIAADPNNAPAYANRGWALARAGVNAKQQPLVDAAMSSFDHALQADPQNAAAHVYRSFTLLFGLDRAADAQAELAKFDALPNKPADLVQLIDDYGLRAAIQSKLGGK